MNGGPLPRSAFAAYLGRNQGPELFYTISHDGTATQTVIPKTLSINRPLEAILLRWSGRLVIGTANYTAAAAESPQTLINRIRIQGTFKGSALAPIDMTGATAFAWGRLFGARGSSVLINNVRDAELTIPLGRTLATLGNTGTYDLDIFYLVPMWPMVALTAKAPSISRYCWQPQDWNDTLQVQVNLGDRTSLGTPGATSTTTWTAFGSASGSPSLRIYTRYLILGPFRSGFRSSCVVRNESQITAGMTAIANNIRIAGLAKQKTSNVLVKTSRNLTGTTAGISVAADLRDTMLDVTQVVVDNRPIRNNQDNFTAKEHAGLQFGTVLPEGYLTFPFIDSQSPRSAFRGDLPNVVAPGSQFELVTNVLEANADAAVNLVQEQIYAESNDPFWAGTR